MHRLEQLRAGSLAGVTRLNLSEGLEQFPREIFQLAESLEILDLSGNALASLPDDLPRLRRLRVLFCSDNQFTELPAVLGQCPALEMVGFKANRIRRLPAAALPPRLRWLILTDNALEQLPAEIGACSRLQKLMLAGNQLRSLPSTLADCRRLELLRISANRLSALPDGLLRLPRLSWLAYAGNPFCAGDEAEAARHTTVAEIPWPQLRLQKTLGEGASGVIHRAEWCRPDGSRAVAVKCFKGAVTSDGLPSCEMAACLSAGDHPNLIPVLGRLVQHPAQVEGLVLSLIAPQFGNLAGPPSLESCTRDVYPAGLAFDASTALRIALGVASATRQLHARGILHGDLYAHNMLHDGQGQVLLGDFGAASLFAADQTAGPSQALQRLESRAFGCLLEELLQHGRPRPEEQPLQAAMEAIRADCLRDDPAARPCFPQLVEALAALQEIAASPSLRAGSTLQVEHVSG